MIIGARKRIIRNETMKANIRTMPQWIPIACMISLYAYTFLYILPQRMKDRVYSSYFDFDRSDPDIAARAMDKNTQRLKLARRYLNRQLAEAGEQSDEHSWSRLPSPNGADITIGIISVQRSIEKERMVHIGYLTQVVAALHRLSNQDVLFSRKNIFICNVDPDGANYQETGQWSSIVDVAVRFHQEETKQISFEPWEKFEKEKSDYQFCMNHSSSYRTPLVALVEDDAVPKEDFFPTLFRMLSKKGLVSGDSGTRERNLNTLGFMKLYYPERWAGYSNEAPHVMELATMAVIGGLLFLLLWRVYTLITVRAQTRRSFGMSYVITMVIGALYSGILAWTVGRPYIIKYTAETWGWYWTRQARQCCTQAVLYSNRTAVGLVKYLSGVQCDIDYSIDLAIDTFVSDHGLPTWLVEPNLVTHIGMFSSLRSYGKTAAEFI